MNTFAQCYDLTITLIWRRKHFIFWKLNGPYLYKTLSPLHPRMLVLKNGWNWHSGPREDCWISFAFCYHLPLEKGVSLYLNDLVLYLPKHALCQVWLKLDQWFWKRTFLKLRQCSFDIPFMIMIFPLGKKRGPSSEQTPLPKYFYAKFGWNLPSGW